MRCRDQVVTRLVEPDVPVGADPEKLQVDTTRCGNRTFVAPALFLQVLSRPVEKADPLGRDIDGVEELFLHDASKASRMRRVDADEFVQVEGRHLRKVDGPGGMAAREFRVDRLRRATRRQPEHQ